MPKTHQLETIMAIGNHPIQIHGINNSGRLKFNVDLFEGEGPYESERRYLVGILNSIPRPEQWNFQLTNTQLTRASRILRSKRAIKSIPPVTKIRKFMGNIHRWYQYWNTHAKIDFSSLHKGEEVSKHQYALPIFLFFVEMIIYLIPFKQDLPFDVELDYPQEMSNAIDSFLVFNTIMNNNPPENGESEIWMERRRSFKDNLKHIKTRPFGIIWNLLAFWMESHYTAVWNALKQVQDLHVCQFVKSFFNFMFTHGIETLNENLRDYLPPE
ncbi:uncharacterized protein VP01_3484g2 [Puccinia sorghi]|uniref:Uncharacterized protein n=1 Tax=Puccinia sorghi TaxID=27349 RepID=A0A0L6UXS7_9BASI|nr:uncharacterized protein VP01_3484g2 [Puccinia sorghi]